MSHHNPPPNEVERGHMLDACQLENDMISALISNTDRIQMLFPTITAKRSQMRRSVGHIRTMWFKSYWEFNERFRLLAYWQKAAEGRTFMDNNY